RGFNACAPAVLLACTAGKDPRGIERIEPIRTDLCSRELSICVDRPLGFCKRTTASPVNASTDPVDGPKHALTRPRHNLLPFQRVGAFLMPRLGNPRGGMPFANG